jgi:hypothetical protein
MDPLAAEHEGKEEGVVGEKAALGVEVLPVIDAVSPTGVPVQEQSSSSNEIPLAEQPADIEATSFESLQDAASLDETSRTNTRGRFNFWAWCCVVSGAALFVPYVTGVVAWIFGVLGLRACNLLDVRGRKFARAGMILGAVNVVGWSCFFGFLAMVGGEEKSLAKRFVNEVAQGNVRAAAEDCLRHTNQAELEGLSKKVNGWGGLKGVSIGRIGREINGEEESGEVDGVLWTGDGGEHHFDLAMVNAFGRWWVTSAKWE